MVETSQLIEVQIAKSIETDPVFEKVKTKSAKWLELYPSTNSDMDSLFFYPDRFEVVVDARGYTIESLKCIVNPLSVEVTGTRNELNTGVQRHMECSRNYQLPQPIRPDQAVCCLSSEGILLICAPWLK